MFWTVGAAVLAVAALGAGGWWWWTSRNLFTLPPATADQNVLLVTIDTLRADALSCYGGPAETPNLDALAAHGARFTFAHAHAVVTLASHTSILTGEYPYTTGVRENSGYRVPAGTKTLATRLKARGFATAAFIGGFPLERRFGLSPGFDLYDDQLGAAQDTGGIIRLAERRADVVVGRALTWIDAQTTPFFAWVHVFDPHAPYEPPEPYRDEYRTQPYYGEVAWTDYALGPLFARLQTLARPTLVIVTADHGEGLGDHGEMTHGIFAYESTLHIPLIVAEVRPGRPPAHGRVIDTPVRHVDIVPTVLDAVGAPADASLPGASLRPVIAHGGGADRPQYFEAMTGYLTRGWAPLRGVIATGDKYIDLPIQELYALRADPTEQHNLAPGQPGRVQVLLNTLKTYDTAPPGAPVQESAATQERLRALGYVTTNANAAGKTFTEADDPKRLIAVDQMLHQASALSEAGKLDQSAAVYERVLAEHPDVSDAYKFLAYVYWQMGRPQQAVATLERALSRGVRDHETLMRLGLDLAQTGQAARAIALLEPSAGDDPDALNALGVAYDTAGRPADAARTFSRILTLDPNNGFAYQNLAHLNLDAALAASGPARTRQLQEAEADARQALHVDPALAGAHTMLGVILAKTDRQAAAIDEWKQAVALDPTDYNALYDLVLTLADAGRKDEARTYGQQFLDTAPPAYFSQELADVRHRIGG